MSDHAPPMSDHASPVLEPVDVERADLDRIERELRDVETALARLADGTYWADGTNWAEAAPDR